jgi:hypothetical protein
MLRLVSRPVRRAARSYHVMSVGPLSAISPVDGRYSGQTEELRSHLSEGALIRQRTVVEIRWLQFLSEHRVSATPRALTRGLVQ